MSTRRRRQNEEKGNVWDFLLGLGLGAVGYAILSALTGPVCPVCRSRVEKGVSRCPRCEAELEWK